ncbi:hypothetical protein DMO16_18560 [Fictibacillus sp. S7]|nr:hypothetical protein DMO16_18560 [Fictibacillus sp. S7]
MCTCTCIKEEVKTKNEACRVAKKMLGAYGESVTIKRGVNSSGGRTFTVLALSQECPKHGLRSLFRSGITYIK